MTDLRRENGRAQAEAADWFTRLSRRSVTTQSLREFRDWRRAPQNRAAYEKVEAVWRDAGGLADDPDIQALRRETGRRTAERSRQRSKALSWSLAAGLLLVGAIGAFAGYQRLPPVYESGVGEQRILRLADGSVLRLNTDSRATVLIGRRERAVTLHRGEALFQVARDPARPFLVSAEGTTVRALGTVFDVRALDDGVDVVLLEGKVGVETPSGRRVTLKPNQQVQVRDGEPLPPVAADSEQITSWTQRRLTFGGTPLAEAVAEVNRYSRQKVRLEATGIAEAPVSGVFETGDTKAFAAAVSSVFDLQISETGSTFVLARRQPVSSTP